VIAGASSFVVTAAGARLRATGGGIAGTGFPIRTVGIGTGIAANTIGKLVAWIAPVAAPGAIAPGVAGGSIVVLTGELTGVVAGTVGVIIDGLMEVITGGLMGAMIIVIDGFMAVIDMVVGTTRPSSGSTEKDTLHLDRRAPAPASFFV
jgi:hypothetical protein